MGGACNTHGSEERNEPSRSINGGEFLEKLSNY
jgi:hypothetical protein